MSISGSKLPPSTARRETEKAGQTLVKYGFVTQEKLDKLLKNPVFTAQERREATEIVREMRMAAEVGGLGTYMVERFATAISKEGAAAEFIAAAGAALAAGVIDAALFGRLSGGDVNLRAAAKVVQLFATAQSEVDRLTAVVTGGAPAALLAKLAHATEARDLTKAMIDRMAVSRERIADFKDGTTALKGVATLLVCAGLALGFVLLAKEMTSATPEAAAVISKFCLGFFPLAMLGGWLGSTSESLQERVVKLLGPRNPVTT